jgi:hypothetical protein
MQNIIKSSLLSLAALATPALANPTTEVTHTLPAIDSALELSLASSSSYGRGGLGGTMPDVDDVAKPGLALDLSIGYRATPAFLIGGYMTLGGYGNPDSDDHGAVTAALGIEVDYHLMPTAKLDPWISVGTGVKLMAIDTGDGVERALTGLELAKVQVGLDYRLSPRFAIGPVLGASATMYRSLHDDTMSDDPIAIEDQDINWTFSLGVLGRFDAFGGVAR